MATLLVKEVNLDGLDIDLPAFVAVTEGGDVFPNDGFTALLFENGATQETTVIIDSVGQCSQGFDHNAGGAVPVSERRMFGPFAPSRFNNAAGNVAITYTGGVTNLTVAAIRVKP